MMQITLTLTLPDFPKIGAVALVRKWAERARSRRHLARLDPHLLKDIGISPRAADAEARRPFWFT